MIRVTKDEADLIRATARDGLHAENVYPSRVFFPVATEPASGRARCRLCEQTIVKGETCCSFMFDAFGKGSWSHLQKAYIHLEC
jgi:hypothetical protein